MTIVTGPADTENLLLSENLEEVIIAIADAFKADRANRGNLTTLQTPTKSNLVQAINEAYARAGGAGSDGKSAFQIWQDQGNTGTITDFLNSLKGTPGTPGTTPTIGVGTVTTGAAGSQVAITEGGTATARTFNFTIPKGDKGDAGTGTAGLSAYQIWLANGNSGTELDFLNSLKAPSSSDTSLGFNVAQFGVSTGNTPKANMDAVNALALTISNAGGGTIIIDGNYTFSGRYTAYSNLTIWHSPRTNIKFIDNDVTSGGTAQPLILRGQSITNFKFLGGRIDGGIQAASATVSLRFEGCTDIEIGGVRFANTKRTIQIQNAAVGTVSENFVIDNVRFGIVKDIAVDVSNTTGTAMAKNIEIRNSFVTNVEKEFTTSPYTAFYMRYVDGAKVINCRVYDSYDTAAMFTHCNDVKVADNKFHTNMVCIYVGQTTTSASVVHNDLESYTDYGVALHDNAGDTSIGHSVVAGNRIHNCGKSGIAIEGVRYASVVYNVIWDCGLRDGTQTRTDGTVISAADVFQRSGIYTETISTGGPEGGKPEYLSIIANVISDTTGKMKYAIRVTGTLLQGVQVIGNSIAPSAGFIETISYISIGTATYIQGVSDVHSGEGTSGPITTSSITDFDTAVAAKIAAVVNGAPAGLDQLNELATALGNDPEYAATTLASINTKVTKTGNESIAGIKTFSSSPIVPAPTTDLQAATKRYVDDRTTTRVVAYRKAGDGTWPTPTAADSAAGITRLIIGADPNPTWQREGDIRVRPV